VSDALRGLISATPATGSLRLVQIVVVDHPLVAHKLTVLRDRDTSSAKFRLLTDELVTLLAYEATRDVRTAPRTVQTPVGRCQRVEAVDAHSRWSCRSCGPGWGCSTG